MIVVFPDHTHLLFFKVVNTLNIFFKFNIILATLKHGLHHWIVSEYELEMPLTRSQTVMEFDHEVISQ